MSGKTYFQCIKNCYNCTGATKDICLQCAPTHYINSTTKECEERIPNCLEYDKINIITNDENNGGGIGYKECLKCDNNNHFYCVDGNKSKCVEVKNYNSQNYYNMEEIEYPCIRKCSDQYYNCFKM